MLLHKEDFTLEINNDVYAVEERGEWESQNMVEFSNQVRVVIEDLDLTRQLGERLRRQAEMRRLLRIAGVRPAIPQARIIHRETPVLDRIRNR